VLPSPTSHDQNHGHNLGQLCDLTANISGLQQYVVKGKTALQYDHFHTYALYFVNFGPQMEKIRPWFWPIENQLFWMLLSRALRGGNFTNGREWPVFAKALPSNGPVWMGLPSDFLHIKIWKLAKSAVYFVKVCWGGITLKFSMWCVLMHSWKFVFIILGVRSPKILELKKLDFTSSVLRLCPKMFSTTISSIEISESVVASYNVSLKFPPNQVYFGLQIAQKRDHSFDPPNGRPSHWALPCILVTDLFWIIVSDLEWMVKSVLLYI